MFRQRGRSAPASPSTRRLDKTARLAVEPLEPRRLLSTASGAEVMTPTVTVVSTSAGASAGSLAVPSGAVSPSELASLYDLSSTYNGSGWTIAIVDAFNDPDIQNDLATFDAAYGIAAANLTVVNQNGGSSLPQTDPGWSLEISLDVEWAHAMAPGAKIVLVEANSANTSDLMQAVKTASGMANVVSMSWGGSEWQGEQAYDSVFDKSYVTFVAASGDDAGESGAEWPSTSPYVVSVGGTTLSGSSETAWSASGSFRSGYSGSAGGFSVIEAQPSYQAVALGTKYSFGRSTPDVSSLANPETGLAVYDSVPDGGPGGWLVVGGTSAGSPVWSAIVADADQARGLTGRKSLSSLDTLVLLYGVSESSGSTTSTYSSVFHDITSGANFDAVATTGYDQVTGLGSPVAADVIADAAQYGHTWAQLVAAGVRLSDAPAVAYSAATSATLRAHDALLNSTSAVISLPPAAAATPVSVLASAVTSTVTTTAVPTAPTLSSPTTPAVSVRSVSPATPASTLPNQPMPPSVTVSLVSTAPDDAPSTEYVPAEPTPAAVPVPEASPAPEPPMSDPASEPLLLPWWDSALDAYFEEESSTYETEPVPSTPECDGSDETYDGLDPAFAAGVALAAWVAAERRSVRPERDPRRRPRSPEPGPARDR